MMTARTNDYPPALYRAERGGLRWIDTCKDICALVRTCGRVGVGTYEIRRADGAILRRVQVTRAGTDVEAFDPGPPRTSRQVAAFADGATDRDCPAHGFTTPERRRPDRAPRSDTNAAIPERSGGAIFS